MTHQRAAPHFRPSRRLYYILALLVLATLSLLITSPVTADLTWSFLGPPPRRLSFPVPGRLQQWIADEDARYSHSLEKRWEFIRQQGRSIESFPTHGQQYTLWDFFIPTFRCPYSTERIGGLGDGGKWVCGMEVLEQQPRCVVYSFGISTDSSFEAEILQRAPGCEVWGYDFSVSGFGPHITHDLQDRSHFYKWGLGGADAHGQMDDPPMYTLNMLMVANGHGFVDILKIDIEGSEFSALSHFLRTLPRGAPLPFGQLQLEIHAWGEYENFSHFLRWWESLEDAGLRPFWTEPNLVYVNIMHGKPDLTEYSFINIRGQHPLVVD